MSKQGKNIDIDDLFRKKLEDYPIEPGVAVRSNLMKRVARREFLRFNPARMNVWYAATAAMVVTVALSLAIRTNQDSDLLTEPVRQSDTLTENKINTIQEPTDTLPAYIDEEETVATEAAKPIQSTSSKGNDRQISLGNLTEITSEKAVPVIERVKPGTTDVALAVKDETRIQVTSVACSFSASELSGCAPLTVALHNTSPKYKSQKWRSSDGRVSVDTSPEWIFTTAGRYTVLLTVTDEVGNQGHSSIEIDVYAAPVARFEIVPIKRESSEKEVMLYNYSEGFHTSWWDFGDGTFSLQREAEHRYSKTGDYRILLTVTSDRGCTDTVSSLFRARTDAFRIDFPNAFIPNTNGPTGGYYSPMSDAAAQVFHPEYEGVSEYHLIIRSRTGVVIFESRDINIGWDGYYRGQLGEPGVYIWQSTGRFTNGESFQKSGDVTLLRVK